MNIKANFLLVILVMNFTSIQKINAKSYSSLLKISTGCVLNMSGAALFGAAQLGYYLNYIYDNKNKHDQEFARKLEEYIKNIEDYSSKSSECENKNHKDAKFGSLVKWTASIVRNNQIYKYLSILTILAGSSLIWYGHK